MVDIVKEPTKRKSYKYECKEDALAAKKKRDNRARTERRRRAVERLTAAQEEENVTKHEEKRWQIQLEAFCST